MKEIKKYEKIQKNENTPITANSNAIAFQNKIKKMHKKCSRKFKDVQLVKMPYFIRII